MIVSALPAAAAYDQPSDWAANAVSWIRSTGKLTAPSDFADYGRTVTRADFARLGVVLYELITGMPTPDASDVKNPFSDTNDVNVLRAYKLGIVTGTGDGTTFTPEGAVNREQIALMLMRTLDVCGVSYSQADVSGVTFSDEHDLSDWAAQAVKRAYLIKVMNGTGGSAMSPKANTTMESAYQLLYNVYTNRDAIRAGDVRIISSGVAGTVTLKYTGGGKYDTGWCEDAYHSQPVVCDLDQDGTLDIVSASYSIVCMDAASGAAKWRVPVGHDRNTASAQPVMRTWPNLYVGDIDGDGRNEIVAGHGSSIQKQGMVAVYDENGYYKPGWPKTLPNEVYSIAVADLDGDGTMEIAAGVGLEDGVNVYVYEHDGTLRPGWPQLDPSVDGNKTPALDSDHKAPTLGFSWGVFNDNIAIGDIDGDGAPEIVVPADMAQICAYDPDGKQVQANFALADGKAYGVTEKTVWGRVGAFSDAAYEANVHNGGFGRATDRMGNALTISSLDMNERRIATFTHSKAVIADVNGDGKNEVAVVGTVHDRAKGAIPSLYQELFLFNGDRTRFNSTWSTAPAATDAPLSEDWLVIDRCMPDPVCADMDGDGKLEIVLQSHLSGVTVYDID